MGSYNRKDALSFKLADADCNGEVNILDQLLIQRFVNGYPIENSCIGDYFGIFMDTLGDCLDNRLAPMNPITHFPGVPLQWSTQNISCSEGNTYEIKFSPKQSLRLKRIQGNIFMDSSLLKVNDFLLSEPNSLMRFSIGAQDVLFTGISKQPDSTISPEFIVRFTALKNFNLSDAINFKNISISPLAVDEQNTIHPISFNLDLINSDNTHQNVFSQVYAYPNPGKDWITISGTIPNTKRLHIELINALGTLVFTKEVKLHEAQMLEKINITIPGLYFLRLTTEKGIKWHQKLEIVR